MRVETSVGLVQIDFQHDPFYAATRDIEGNYLVGRIKGITLCNLRKYATGKSLTDRPHVGRAYCSINDQYNKEVGRKVLLTKVLQLARISKEDRTLIWKSYLNRK